MNHGTRAYERLREEIVEWRLPPGTHLSEIRLADRLGVSRTPLREALHRLAADNLVKVVPGRGAFVTEISLADVRHLFQLREALETYAVRLCARSPRRAGFDELAREFATHHEALARDSHSGRRDDDRGHGHGRGRDCDREYAYDHDAYYALTERLDAHTDRTAANPHLSAAALPLRAQLRRLRRIARGTPERLARSAEEHLLICTAIAEGDESRAAELTASHIDGSLRNILAALAEGVGRTVPEDR